MDRVDKLIEQAMFHFYSGEYERTAEISEMLIKDGYVEGYTILGLVFAAIGDDESLNTALNFFEEAAQKGEEVGKFFLGFYTGTLNEKDYLYAIYNFKQLSYFILKMLPDFIDSKNKDEILDAIFYSYSLKDIEDTIEMFFYENELDDREKEIFFDILELVDKIKANHKRMIKRYLGGKK
jgi:hypothetical protein